MTRFFILAAASLALLSLLAACGPTSEIRFDGKKYRRGAVATEGAHESWLYSIPADGIAQNSRIGVITSTSQDAVALNRWITSEYVAAMSRPPNVRALEQVSERGACKVGVEGTRPFVAIGICADVGKRAACLELDERVDSSVVASPAAACEKWRGDHEAELRKLLPVVAKN